MSQSSDMVLIRIMKLFVIPFALLFTASFPLGSQSSQSTSEQTGRLKVTVFDTIDRIVPNITVVIQGNGIKRTFVSGEQESHEFDLPVGIYTITSEKGYGYNYPFKRAPVRIESGTTTLINVLAPMRVLVTGTTVGTESVTQLATEPKYEIFRAPNLSAPELTLVVQYDQKHERGKIIEYKDGARPFSGVIVTYDALTVIADVIRVDKETLRIEATGNVIIEDGKKRTHFQDRRIVFKEGKAINED
jgi:hypothetical protein